MDKYFKSNPYKFINDYVGNLKWYQKLLLKLYCKRKDKQIRVLSVDLASDSELHFNNGSQIIISDGKHTRGLRSKIKGIM